MMSRGETRKRRAGQPWYAGPVRAALEKGWRAANGISYERLVPALAEFVVALERQVSI